MDTVFQKDIIATLFAGYATFTAFGAAVAGYLAAGGALQNFAVWWTQHGKAEAMRPRGSQPRAANLAEAKHEYHEQQEALEWAARRSPITIKAASVLIGLVVVISGVGLLFSFLLAPGL